MTRPLLDMLKESNGLQYHGRHVWHPKTSTVISTGTNPDYNKQFLSLCGWKNGFVNAVLTQRDADNHLIVYVSCQLNQVEKGVPPMWKVFGSKVKWQCFFVDISSFVDGNQRCTGYAVVMPQKHTIDCEVFQSVKIPQPSSVQVTEITAVTAACRMTKGKPCTIYTDSAYA